jgi:MEMO1 family protein
MPGAIRQPAVAGSWYPSSPRELAATVDGYLRAAEEDSVCLPDVVALISPHAGLRYSGPIAAYAYRQLRGRPIDVVVLVGPSHFTWFAGVSVFRGAGFDTPLGLVEIENDIASSLIKASAVVKERPAPHAKEHSLEMQLPFVRRVAPEARIVPLLMGEQDADVVIGLADALGSVLAGRRSILIASTDLSHYHDAATAAGLDAVVIDCASRADAEGLQRAIDRRPDHACGGGPTVAVMRAARLLGGDRGVVLKYGDSGDVSGDKSSVVGYLAAAIARGSDLSS